MESSTGVSGTLGVDAGDELLLALVLETTEVAAALGQGADGAVDELVDEELHVGATLGDAVRDAGEAEVGREAAAEVDAAADHAGHDLEAADGLALAAVVRAVGARLELVGLADAVAAHGAHAAVLR